MQAPWMIAFIVQWMIVLILVFLVLGILRHLSVLEGRWDAATPPISSYEIGQRIAEFELADATGTRLRSSDLLEYADGAVLLFVSATCAACVTLLSQVSELVGRRDITLKHSLVVVGVGSAGTVQRLLEMYPDLSGSKVVILSDDEGSALHQFGITSVPTAIRVDRDGRVIDQSLNPHVEKWLYGTLGTAPLEEPTSGTYVSVVRNVPMRGRR